MEQTDPTKVGSSAGRAAAERRRIAHPTGGRNPSRFFCTIPGCGAQFTAKHNYNWLLQCRRCAGSFALVSHKPKRL
ncbi:hypothetical protein LENED_009051 [Lentinula edodes]|uniref:Uncharacterized protein n=1 Tax=Lentinula edodes TaxID=5353 RepID=A0A1Q3EIR9_LENED|nr:hypothetical protein LENED_009051 [Lentinula edodes]